MPVHVCMVPWRYGIAFAQLFFIRCLMHKRNRQKEAFAAISVNQLQITIQPFHLFGKMKQTILKPTSTLGFNSKSRVLLMFRANLSGAFHVDYFLLKLWVAIESP